MFKKEVARESRSIFNNDILKLMCDYFKANPDMRFQQGLYNLGFVDTDEHYGVESDNDYHRLLKLVRQELKIKKNDDNKMLMSKEDVLKHPFIDQDIKDRIAKETENKPEQLHYEWQGLEPAPDPVYSKSAIKVKHILEMYGTALDDAALDVIENDKEFQIEILSIALEGAEGLIKAQSAFIRRNTSK